MTAPHPHSSPKDTNNQKHEQTTHDGTVDAGVAAKELHSAADGLTDVAAVARLATGRRGRHH